MGQMLEKHDEVVDAIIVGAGFSGLYMAHKLRESGLSLRGFEAGGDVGGTWYWNRYPGARCDVPSLFYSYSWSDALLKEWTWTEKYATQPEILRYLTHIADRYDLRRDFRFDTRVESATFDDDTGLWTVVTGTGDTARARYCIMATGCLSVPREPAIKNADSFSAAIYHTGRWPHEGVDFTGQRVAIIGTGSSGIQSIPVIAEQASHLTVFQRTPNFSIPARNTPLTEQDVREFWAGYPAYRKTVVEGASVGFPASPIPDLPNPTDEQRRRRYEQFWEVGGAGFLGVSPDVLANPASNAEAAAFVRQKIAETVKDPKTAAALMPHDHPIGTKRICVDIEYYETFNRDNVALVDLRTTPIEEIVPSGIRTTDRTYDFDAIVFATGFDAMTGALLNIDIRGSNGVALRDAWHEGPRTYLGLAVSGFPNLFTITGPGSPSVLSNMVTSIEQHVDWIADCIGYMRKNRLARIEADTGAQDAWVQQVNAIADMTLFPRANSWYIGANIPGKPRVFMPYIGPGYRQKCDAVAANGYEGFALTE